MSEHKQAIMDAIYKAHKALRNTDEWGEEMWGEPSQWDKIEAVVDDRIATLERELAEARADATAKGSLLVDAEAEMKRARHDAAENDKLGQAAFEKLQRLEKIVRGCVRGCDDGWTLEGVKKQLAAALGEVG